MVDDLSSSPTGDTERRSAGPLIGHVREQWRLCRAVLLASRRVVVGGTAGAQPMLLAHVYGCDQQG